MRRRIVAKPGLLLEKYSQSAAVLYKEGPLLLDCILVEHRRLVGGDAMR
jgi:hypothetical protein